MTNIFDHYLSKSCVFKDKYSKFQVPMRNLKQVFFTFQWQARRPPQKCPPANNSGQRLARIETCTPPSCCWCSPRCFLSAHSTQSDRRLLYSQSHTTMPKLQTFFESLWWICSSKTYGFFGFGRLEATKYLNSLLDHGGSIKSAAWNYFQLSHNLYSFNFNTLSWLALF